VLLQGDHKAVDDRAADIELGGELRDCQPFRGVSESLEDSQAAVEGLRSL
jgi:hypothetical protein